MKLTFEIDPALSIRFKQFLLDRYGTTYRVQQLELQKALELYLDQFAKAPPVHEKESRKKVSREGEVKRPRIADDPLLVSRIDEMLADGKNIADIARAIGYAWSTVKSYLKKRESK